MPRELKIWNGRGCCCHKSEDPAWLGIRPSQGGTVYAAAYSRADLRRLIAEYCGRDPGEAEIRDYWHSDAWGDAMDGITPERGIWLRNEKVQDAPIRLI